MTASITKFEIFDRMIATRLLKQDESIVTAEEKKMITKLLRKVKGNLLEVKYNFAKGYENLKVGRIYANGSQSLGCMSGNIVRSPMCEKYYFDIDQVNAHYNIAWQYAEKRGLSCEHIQNYCENREECLEKAQEQYGIDRTDAKILYLKIAYGGNLPDDCPEMTKSMKTEDVLPLLQIEMRKLADYVWDQHPSWQELKGQKHILRQSGHNKKFKMLSLFLQTEERKILEAMDKCFTAMGRSVDILIHDGCMIRKNEKEETFPRDLMNQCEEFVREYTGYKVKLEQKPIEYGWELEEEEERVFDVTGFWKDHFMMNGKIYRESEHYDRPQLITSANTYAMQFYKQFDCQAEDTLKKISMNPVRAYTRFGFYPYGIECPAEIYNTFNGFKWTELYDCAGKLTNDKYKELIEEVKERPWKKSEEDDWDNSKTKWQIEQILCYNEDPEIQEHNIKYFMNVLGRVLFDPTKPTEKVLCLRNEKGGSGKTGLLERHFADKLLGEEYFTSQSSSKHIFGEFNASISGKLFVLCEEAETKDTKDFTSQVKAAVTRKRNPIRLMRTDIYNENNYCTYVANTNKQTAFEFDPKNRRRFPQIDCKEYTLTKEDEEKLKKETEDPYYNKLFFEYILCKYDPDFDFNKHPEAESVKVLHEQFRSPFAQFFELILYHWDAYYDDKYFHVANKKLSLHELDKWKIKAEVFCDLYKEITKGICGDEFAKKIKFAAFRQNPELCELMKKYPKYFVKKINNYVKKDSHDPPEIGTFYHIDLKAFREFYNPEHLARPVPEKKTTVISHFRLEEPSPKKQKTKSESEFESESE